MRRSRLREIYWRSSFTVPRITKLYLATLTSHARPSYNPIKVNLMFTHRPLTVALELFAAGALVIWIATGCVLLAINGAPP